MFDISFTELLIIAVVALVVIGPERLPKVARTVGHLFGRMQRYVNDVKADISREMQLDELKKLQSTVQEAARDIETSVNREMNRADQEVRSLADEVEKSASAAGEAAPSEAAPDTSRPEPELPDKSRSAAPEQRP